MPRKSTTTLAQERVGIRLSSHEKLCAERMLNIQKAIERLERKVEQLQQNVNKGKGAVAVLVFFGSLVAAAIGYLSFK